MSKFTIKILCCTYQLGLPFVLKDMAKGTSYQYHCRYDFPTCPFFPTVYTMQEGGTVSWTPMAIYATHSHPISYLSVLSNCTTQDSGTVPWTPIYTTESHPISHLSYPTGLIVGQSNGLSRTLHKPGYTKSCHIELLLTLQYGGVVYVISSVR